MKIESNNLKKTPRQQTCRLGRRSRRGGLFSFELLLIAPVISALLFGIVEMSFLWSAKNQIQAACDAACRVGTLPANNPQTLRLAVQRAANAVLSEPSWIDAQTLEFRPGRFSGDPVVCRITLPMDAAAPNLLAIVGLNLEGRTLQARTVMRKE